MKKITIKDAKKIAKSVLNLLHRVDPLTINIDEQINGHLKYIGIGWILKDATYIDVYASTSISALAHDIRNSAIEKF
jgi:hypothetical protein